MSKLTDKMNEEAAKSKQSVFKWFDLDNKEHLLAAKHLLANGKWPPNYPPEGEASLMDALTMACLLSQAYLEDNLNELE